MTISKFDDDKFFDAISSGPDYESVGAGMLEHFEQQVDAARSVLRAGLCVLIVIGIITAVVLW